MTHIALKRLRRKLGNRTDFTEWERQYHYFREELRFISECTGGGMIGSELHKYAIKKAEQIL